MQPNNSNVSKRVSWTIPALFKGKSLLDVIETFHIAKKTLNWLFVNQKIKRNGTSIAPHEVLATNDCLTFDFTDFKSKEVEPYPGNLTILYEDQDLLMVDKPSGMLVHTDGNTLDTLTNRVKAYTMNHPNVLDALPVHRIDVDTSGIVLFAKNPLEHAYLSHAMEHHDIHKTYHCLVEGVIKDEQGVIQTSIGKDRHSQRQIITSKGQSAYTEFRVIKRYQKTSLLHVVIKTGRKHQIRVHLTSIGHPIVGDTLYGATKAPRLMLHHHELVLIHPLLRKSIRVQSPSPF